MAGFNTAVTGLKSASQMLDVAGNNIANSSTVGFKSTRTEFADIYATSVVGAGSSNQPGSGVTVSDISQDFSAGTIEFTNNNLDLAINGSGFFQLDDGQGGITYTRAGSFELDKDGFIVSKNGKYLQGYGLDAQGNQLPLQTLSVTQKESAPKATESISLSVNIDSSADATALARTFDKNNPASYTYSTTVETVDSLGNANSIRFYLVEQAPVRTQYDFTVAAPVGPATQGPITVSTVEFSAADLIELSGGAASGTLADQLAALEEADPRIDIETLSWDAGTNRISFEFKSQHTNDGDVVIRAEDDGGASLVVERTALFPAERDANEVHRIGLVADPAAAGVDTGFEVEIAGVIINVSGTYDTTDKIGDALESFERDIIDKNPDIESVTYDTTSNELVIRYKAEVGELDNVTVVTGTDASAVFAGDANTDGIIDADEMEVVKGDNSYLATYRTYAYLNDEIAIDVGKAQDPGEGSDTEVGAILVSFDSTTGQLSSVNGLEVRGGNAPPITITGADPANPNDDILDNDVDSLAGIQLDISGSSQFASESIVKSASQDGYPKGDLIGVTFAETGEMVASFSNGQRQNLGLVAIASFENQAGLSSAGSTEWIATLNSGAAILNPPGTGLNGTLRSAALESSNVDLSAELVKLIEAQRNFQANSKTLETQNTVTQAILQI